MDAKQIKEIVEKKLAGGKSGASLVLASFSSIYACRSDLRA